MQSLDEVKARVSIEDLVRQTGQEPTYRRNLHCPFHEDSSPSLHIYQDGGWKCFGCGKHGDTLDWLGYALYGDQYDPASHLRDVIDHVGELGVKPLPTTTRAQVARPKVATRELGDLAASYHRSLTSAARAYWQGRGLEPETVARFGLGWDALSERYTIPAVYRGLCFGIKKRASKDGGEKYIQQAGSRVGLFNSDVLNTTDYCVICEGEIDCMTLDQAGLPAVSSTGGASTFRPQWARFFAHCKDVFVCFDNDDAGTNGALAVRALMPRARLVKVPDGYKDINEWALGGGNVGVLLGAA